MQPGTFKAKKIVDDFLQHCTGFEQLVIAFVQMHSTLKNPRIKDYIKRLDDFHQHHYHKFLFHTQHRIPECRQFIETITEFEKIKKPAKEKYKLLFDTLTAFQVQELPGGHYRGKPFLFTDRAIQKWYYDEVQQLQQQNKCKNCHCCSQRNRHPVLQNGVWSGQTDCPANGVFGCTKETHEPYATDVMPYLLKVDFTNKQEEELTQITSDNQQNMREFVELVHSNEDNIYQQIQTNRFEKYQLAELVQKHGKQVASLKEQLLQQKQLNENLNCQFLELGVHLEYRRKKQENELEHAFQNIHLMQNEIKRLNYILWQRDTQLYHFNLNNKRVRV